MSPTAASRTASAPRAMGSDPVRVSERRAVAAACSVVVASRRGARRLPRSLARRARAAFRPSRATVLVSAPERRVGQLVAVMLHELRLCIVPLLPAKVGMEGGLGAVAKRRLRVRLVLGAD